MWHELEVEICHYTVQIILQTTSMLLYTYKILRVVILRLLQSTGHLENFNLQTFIGKTFINFGLESRVHMNGYVWPLQGMVASFYL